MEEKITVWALVATFVSLLFLGVYCLFHVAMSNVGTDYCYVAGVPATKDSPATFNLVGHRPWNTDIFIDNYSSLPAVMEAANSIGCYVR